MADNNAVNQSLSIGNDVTKMPAPVVKVKDNPNTGLTKNGFAPISEFDRTGQVNPQETAITQPQDNTTPTYSWWDTFSRNTAPLARSIYAGVMEHRQFQPDVNYDPEQDYKTFEQVNGIRSKEELDYLYSAESKSAFDYRTHVLLDRRKRDDALQQHVVAGVAGSLLDADIALSAALPEVKGVTTAARTTQRLAYAGALTAGTAATMEAVGTANPMSDTEKTWALVGMGAAGLFTPSARKILQNSGSAVDNTLGSTAKTYAVNDVPAAPITRSVPDTLPTDVLQRGKPYTNRQSAQTALQSQGMSKTHEIVEVSPNKYVLRSKQDALGASIQQELNSLNDVIPAAHQEKFLAGLTQEELNSTKLTSNSEAKAFGDIPIGNDASITARIPLNQAPDALPSGTIEKKWYNYLTSVSDQLRNYVSDPNSIVHKLLASPFNRGDNVTEAAQQSLRSWQYALEPVKRGLDYGVRRLFGVNPVMGRLFKKDYSAAYVALSKDFMHNMQSLDDIVERDALTNMGKVMDNTAIHNIIDSMPLQRSSAVDPNDYKEIMQGLMKQYVDSKFATSVYDRFTSTKLMDSDIAEQLIRRPTYMPIQHSYDQIRFLAEGQGIEKAAGRMEQIAEFLGHQIMRMYPNAWDKAFQLTPKQIGQHFIETQRLAAENFGIRTIGYTKDQLKELLTTVGKLDSKVAHDTVERVFTKVETKSSGVGNFKRRLNWDWTAKGMFDNGQEFSLADLVNPNITGTLDQYSNSLARRTALAEYGIKSEAALADVWKQALANIPVAERKNAERLFKSIHNSLMGKPVGEDVHPVMRSLQTVAGMMNLANSGIFNLVDLNTQLLKIGYIRSMPHMLAAMKPAILGMKKFSASEAKTVEDVLTGKLMVLDAWKPFITRYADQFDISSARHEGIEYFGQSTRFLNMSEQIKRYQIGLLAGVFGAAFKGAAKGSASDIKFLKKGLKFSDQLVDEISKQYQKHGNTIDAWDSNVRIAMERKVFHEADNMAFSVHEGEIPEILQYSAVGKVIFPYMRYTFAMTNKIMKRTYVQDGSMALAILMAHQVPMAILVASLQNLQAGKPLDTDLVRKSMNAVSSLGILSYPVDMLMSSGLLAGASNAIGVDPESSKLLGQSGQTANSAPVFTPITKTLKLMNKAVDPNKTLTIRDIKQNTVLNSVPALGIFLNAVEDKGDSNK